MFAVVRPSQLVAVALAASLLAPLAATAQPSRAGAVALGAYGGFTLLSGDNQLGNAPDPANRPGSGPTAGLRLGYHLSDLLALEVEVDATHSTFADSGLSSALLGYRASALWHFSTGTLRPFAFAGIGSTATLWREHGTELDGDITGMLGAGVKYALSERLDLRADARYYAMDGAERAISHSFAATVGVSLRLNASPAPAPAAAVAVAVAPPPPPPVDPDTDGDGLNDGQDKCPRQVGSAEDGGCPPPDKDGDGIADRLDKCPDQQETFNGRDDEDGCPDGEATVVVSESGLELKQKVFFELGNAAIKAESFKLLDTVAAVLKQRVVLTKVAIEGHTDDVGDAEVNQTLSQTRAAAVVDYLVGKGVAAGRLVAEGYGATRPLCAELPLLLKHERKNRKKVEACRERNRRVQFRVIKADEAVR